MTDDVSPQVSARSTLRGSWLAIHRITLVLLPVVIVVVLTISGIQLAGPNPPPWWFPTLVVAVAAFLLWIQVRTATEVVLDATGTLTFRRTWLGEVRAPAASVHAIGRPLLGGRRSGVRVRAAEVTVPLAVGMDVGELVDAVAVHNPELRVGTL